MADRREEYLAVRKELAQFCAEQSFIYQPYDARYEKAVELRDSDVPEWRGLIDRTFGARARLSPADKEELTRTDNLCQEIGHFRIKKDVGKLRFVCITCCCVFDADPDSQELNIYGPRGGYIPGTISPPPDRIVDGNKTRWILRGEW